MPRVLRTGRAELDLLDIWLYVAEYSVEAAEGLLDSINEKAHMLADSPLAGRSRDELAPGLRSFPTGSYLIFYRVIPDGVEIVRVLHGSRDIPSEIDTD